MRLFIAIDIPYSVTQHLEKLQQFLPVEGISKINSFHLTLQFLGECDQKQADQIIAALKQIHFRPFQLTLTDIGRFGLRVPRVIWVGVTMPIKLSNLVADIVASLNALSLASDHPFAPHITLARVKHVRNLNVLSAAVSKMKVAPLTWQVDRFYLYRSRLQRNGAVHEVVATFSASK